MADKYDYSVDSYTNEQEVRSNATSIFFSCGLPLVIIFAPELIELHFAGHNVAMFFIGLGLYILWAAAFLIFIARPIRKKGLRCKKTGLQNRGTYIIVCSNSRFDRIRTIQMGLVSDILITPNPHSFSSFGSAPEQHVPDAKIPQ